MPIQVSVPVLAFTSTNCAYSPTTDAALLDEADSRTDTALKRYTTGPQCSDFSLILCVFLCQDETSASDEAEEF